MNIFKKIVILWIHYYALTSCYGVSFINDKDLILEIAISNLPADYSGTTELAITVISNKAKNYRYKVGPSGALDCAIAAGYSDSKDIAESIRQSIASIPDGPVKICVAPVQLDTMDLEKHIASTWIKDAACPNRPFNAGTGTVSDPYLICSPDSLIYMSQNVSALAAKYFRLTANLDLTATAFEGLGTNASPFTGHFDGNGNTITGFSRAETDPIPVGFFNVVGDNTTIQNLNFVGANISGGNFSGVVVGFADGNLTMTNLSVSGAVNASYSGSLVGYYGYLATKTLIISNVSNSATVSGSTSGGIVGLIEGDAIISNASNTGSISGGFFSGGIIGACTGSSGSSNCVLNLSNSQNLAAIAGFGRIGGIAGHLHGQSTAELRLRKIFNSGNLSGFIDFGGGLAGSLYGGQVEDSYSTGTISAIGIPRLGGLVGDVTGGLTRFYRSYATGSITDNGGSGINSSICGGLLGLSTGSTSIYDSFATGSVVCSNSANRVGRLIGYDTLGSTISNCSSVTGSTCTNPVGSCSGPAGAGRPSVAHFHNSGNAPVSSWDTATIWLFTGSALPTLR